jgi:hypothetical protein
MGGRSNLRRAAGEHEAASLVPTRRSRLWVISNQHQNVATTVSALAERTLHLISDWLEQIAHHGAASGLQK